MFGFLSEVIKLKKKQMKYLNFFLNRNIYLRNSRMKLGNIGLSKLVKQDIMLVKDKKVDNGDEALYYSSELLERNGESFDPLDDVW